MYLKHFKLKKRPFDQLPNPDFLYLTEQHEEAFTRMRFSLAVDDSFTIITGEVGSGKTTLIRKLLSDISDECTPAFITHTRLSDIELLQLILVEFGIRPFSMGKVEMITELRQYIGQQHDIGRRVVIVVDEAQNLEVEILEELRLLTCLDSVDQKAVNIILIGQPQLSRILDSPDLEQLRQRCRLQFHLHGLSKEETEEYIRHRLTIAKGRKIDLFDVDAAAAVFQHTRGVPRLVNTLCDTALMMARISERKLVSMDSIEDAVNELGWTAGGSGNGLMAQNDIAAGPVARLTVSQGSKFIGEFSLDHLSYIIGRGADCSIMIDSKFLSRHHAIVNCEGREWTIMDLNSTNGVSVNGRTVQSWRLRDGDKIDIGINQLKFILDDPTNRASTDDATDSELAMMETVVIDEAAIVKTTSD